MQDASQSLRMLQQQEWANKMSDNLSAISETIATERQKSMTAVKQVESLRDDLLSLQETTRIAMEAMLNNHRKIEAALSNGKACSYQDMTPFRLQSTASIVEELKGKAGKAFDSQDDSTPLKSILPSTCQYSSVISPGNTEDELNSRFNHLVDGINDACHHRVPSHDLRWEKTPTQ